MKYNDLNDDERAIKSREAVEYINREFAKLGSTDERNEVIRHLTREMQTLTEYINRMNLARSILTAGQPQATRLALMALDGVSIDQMMREALTTDEAR